MTEVEWLVSTDRRRMLRFLLGTDLLRLHEVESFPDCRTTDRKLRLFACACVGRILHALAHPLAQAAVDAAERVADGLAPAAELEAHYARGMAALTTLEERGGRPSGVSGRPCGRSTPA